MEKSNVIPIKERPLRPGKKNHQGEGGGYPRTFKSGAELIERFNAYIEHIKANDFDEMPTKTNFAKWCHCDRRNLYDTLVKYYPDHQDEYKDILAETLAEGAARGKYNVTMSIFCLKNWCDWSDKRESININSNKQVATPEEAKDKIKQIAERLKDQAL